jgi:hypothetical protein
MFDRHGKPFRLKGAVADDELIPLTKAAALLPYRRRGRPTHVATVYGWTLKGCRGEYLRFVQVGATRCTTPAWLAEFFARLTLASQSPGTSPGAMEPVQTVSPIADVTSRAADAGRRLEEIWGSPVPTTADHGTPADAGERGDVCSTGPRPIGHGG